MPDDLRDRIVRAIEAEADLAAGELERPAWGAVRAEALELAAEIARRTPDAVTELAGRVAGLEARVRDLEERGTDDGR